MEILNNKKSILKESLNSRLQNFFMYIEEELQNLVRQVESDFQDAIKNFTSVSIKLGRLNKTNPSFKSTLLEKICDSKIALINKVKETYTEEFIINSSFTKDNYKIEEAFCSEDCYGLVNEYVLSDLEVDLKEAKCDIEIFNRVSDLFDKIESKQKQLA